MRTSVAVGVVMSLLVVGGVAVQLAAVGEESSAHGDTIPPSPAPQPQETVPEMVEAAWSAGPPMPQGMQDNQVTLIHNWIISACGFCGGADDDWKPGKYPRGFLNKVWGLDLGQEEKGWQDLPSLPGAKRQGMQGTRINDALCCWGGFSYTEPYAYKDGYRLSRKEGEWVWDDLPPLPSPSVWGGVCGLGSRIYVLGGADYDAQRFYTHADRNGEFKGLGNHLIVLDAKEPEAGWRALAPCPGAPRCLAAAAVVDGKLYFIGGVAVAPDSGSYCNVVDSWRYDPAEDAWERLRDMPISGAGACSNLIVYKDRYVLLPCGYQYDTLMRPDGSLEPSYGTPSTVKRTWKSHPRFETTHYFNHFYVYDTRTNLYGTATALPFDDVASITVVEGDTAYMFPGETAGFVWEGEYFGHHPEFVLKGQLKELDWE